MKECQVVGDSPDQ